MQALAFIALAGLIAWAVAGKKGKPASEKPALKKPVPAGTPPDLKQVIQRHKEGKATCAELRGAAKQARAHGLKKVAAKFDEWGDIVCAVEESEKSRLPSDLKVPPTMLKYIKTPGAWNKFVKALKLGKVGTKTPKNYLGLFNLGYRRLEDLGYVTDVSKDDKGVWSGTWRPPLSEEEFLSNAKLQYDAFVKHIIRNARVIARRHKNDITDKRTLSGLLGVAHRRGLKGMAEWLKDPSKYPKATTIYERTNQLF